MKNDTGNEGTRRRAETAYAENRAEVQGQLEAISRLLIAHEKRRAATPRDWGFAGDLGRVKVLLGEAVRFLAGGEEDDA